MPIDPIDLTPEELDTLINLIDVEIAASLGNYTVAALSETTFAREWIAMMHVIKFKLENYYE